MKIERSVLSCCGLLLMLGAVLGAPARATQAGATDLMDFITRMGGWFRPVDSSKYRDSFGYYWQQVTYQAAPPAVGSNITTITMTKYNEERQDVKTGALCTTETVVTDTVTIDLRELRAATTAPSQDKDGIWSVSLVINSNKPLIRVKEIIAAPQTFVPAAPASSSSGSPTGAGGGAPSTGVIPPTGTVVASGSASSCSAQPRNGYAYKATTRQSDEYRYPIQFAGLEQARYFQMLVASAVPTFTPPRLVPAPLP